MSYKKSSNAQICCRYNIPLWRRNDNNIFNMTPPWQPYWIAEWFECHLQQLISYAKNNDKVSVRSSNNKIHKMNATMYVS